MKHVDAGKFGEKEKRKQGCEPKADKQEYRYMVRLNEAKNKRFLSMYGQSGIKTMSRFMADCVLNKPIKTVKYVMRIRVLLINIYESTCLLVYEATLCFLIRTRISISLVRFVSNFFLQHS
ncbi:hypothetical protein EZS27_020314 [termite gut metagenome]|uniref:Uncharacterized protein n=1 Tax=termite gut metagenome TaxID=433724 RepID=A0A5J4RCB3_9ZZZZ